MGQPERLRDRIHDHGLGPAPQSARPCASLVGCRPGRVAARHGGCAGRVQKRRNYQQPRTFPTGTGLRALYPRAGMAEVESAQEQAHPERFDPRGAKGELVEAEHRARYWWAADYVEGKQVLDAGCGTGFGTAILSERRPARLVGVDISEEAVERAGDLAPRADELRQADVRELPFADSTFDVVVCFEVIEHIDRQDEALDELRRVLRPTGCLLISSPNRDVYTPGNPHHVHEYAREELEAALRGRFDHVALFMQHPWLASAISAGGPPSPEPASGWRIAFVGDELQTGGETYTLALASASPGRREGADRRHRKPVRGSLVERAGRGAQEDPGRHPARARGDDQRGGRRTGAADGARAGAWWTSSSGWRGCRRWSISSLSSRRTRPRWRSIARSSGT